MNLRPVTRKSNTDIAREWDEIAIHRFRQITSGRDLSYSHLLTPTILRLIGPSRVRRALDVGCGAGLLTKRLAAMSREIVGVDLSRVHISLARQINAGTGNASFIASSLEAYARTNPEPFTLAIANMTLMTAIKLDRLLEAVRRLLARDAVFVLTITHPCFWPQYWGYANAPWFEYTREIFIEGYFRITLDKRSRFRTTHIHRSLEHYSRSLARHGFRIEALQEPMPSKTMPKRYLKDWREPRFLAMRCRRG